MLQHKLQGRSHDRSPSHSKNKKGFTIIEVVLVLAIAGLIFLMVFIALPALQSSQRNTQRENDLDRFLTAVTDYASNNSGRLPFRMVNGVATEMPNFVVRYIDDTCEPKAGATSQSITDCTADQFRDPDGNLYAFNVVDGQNLATGVAVPGLPTEFTSNNAGTGAIQTIGGSDRHVITAVIGVMCGVDEGTVTEGTGDRQVSLYMIMEGGGVACVANS